MSFGDARDHGFGKPPDRLTRPHQEWPTPNVEDLILVEDVLVSDLFKPLCIGTARDQYSNLKLVKEKEVEGTGAQQYVRRIWATARAAQDAYNLALKYTSDSATAPVYIRSSLIPRGEYAALTEGTPLTSVISLALTASGDNYTYANVVITGTGSGATAVAQVRNGGVVGILLTAGGTGFTATPTVTISGDGTGATATGSIQPQAALLTSQEMQPTEGDLGQYFVQVRRIWTTLPGPSITTTKLAEDGSTITITRQMVAIGNIVTSETLTGGATPWVRKYKGEGNAVYAEQITESRPIPGNAITTTKIDSDGVPVSVTKTLKAIGNITTGETLVGITWTKVTRQDADSALVAYEVSESRAIPGISKTYRLYDSMTDTVVTETRVLIAASTAELTPIPNELTDYRDVPVDGSSLVMTRIVRQYPATIVNKTITEYKRERYTYPALLELTSNSFIAYSDANDNEYFSLNPTIEAERPRMVPHKLYTTFQTISPSNLAMIASITEINPVRHQYNGVLFDVRTGPVICNEINIQASTSSSEPRGIIVETYQHVASVPNLTSYVSNRTAKNWFIMDRESKKIAASLYMVTEISVPYK